MVCKEEEVNKEKPDGNVQAELAISVSCAPSKNYLLSNGYKADYLRGTVCAVRRFYAGLGTAPS